jgi:hypothetical protein
MDSISSPAPTAVVFTCILQTGRVFENSENTETGSKTGNSQSSWKADSRKLSGGSIHRKVESVRQQSVSKWGNSLLSGSKSPLHDGDIEKPDNPIFKNCYYLNAKCKEPPQIVDQNVQPIVVHIYYLASNAYLYDLVLGKQGLPIQVL